MKPFSLDHLSATDFEQFCYDLLKELKFQNINWRKGTGYASSPADRGRDIECQLLKTDIDGEEYLETWFVECKHYEQGVPPDKIQGALSWAVAERPDKLLIIVSNFFSNATKDYLETYQRKNTPTYKIKLWEKPDLEKMASSFPELLKKYKISNEFPFVSIMHPFHLLYLKHRPLNSLDYLFKQLDKIIPSTRQSLLYEVSELIASPNNPEYFYDW